MSDDTPATVHDETVEQTPKEKRPRGRPRKPTPPPKPPKEKKPSLYKDNKAEWFKQYYRQKVIKQCKCETCGTEFCTEANLRRHEGRNKFCMILRLQKHLEVCKQNPANPLDVGVEMSEESPATLTQN